MDIFKHYNHQIFETHQNPDVREESFYGILSNFLYQFQSEILSLKSEIHITTLPKKTEAGSPDFKVRQGLNTIGYERLKPSHPNYFFVPKADNSLQKEYSESPSVTEIFKLYNSAAVSRNDDIAIQFKKGQIKSIIKNLISDRPDEEVRQIYKIKDSYNWSLPEVRQHLIEKGISEDNFMQICYRPFDFRWTYFEDKFWSRTCRRVSDLMRTHNFGLCLMRASSAEKPFFITDTITTQRVIPDYKGFAYLFPLYLYQKTPSPRKRFQFNGHVAEPPAEYLIRIHNLSEKFIELITQKYDKDFVSDGRGDLKKTIGPENILAYIYVVLYSKNYRERYHDFLKTDFPQIPFADFREFKRLSELGSELIALHTMKHPSINETTVKFPITGENIVKRVRYDSNNKRIFINDEQYFEGIEESLWNYLIGGYQVLNRWLKYRIGRSLDSENIIYFMKIAKAIEETIKIEEAL
jgi:predicted helicase